MGAKFARRKNSGPAPKKAFQSCFPLLLQPAEGPQGRGFEGSLTQEESGPTQEARPQGGRRTGPLSARTLGRAERRCFKITYAISLTGIKGDGLIVGGTSA